MTQTVLSDNLKKFRTAKGFTQEQIAEALHINAQTVSRWECGTTLPDVLTLPELAKLYGVTVDDFYRKHSVAYDNYAQRLSAIYERTHDPEDFIRCRLEYLKLIKNGDMSTADKWNYATIHHFMLRFCRQAAFEWYDKAIADGPESNPFVYKRARSLRNYLMFELGKVDEVIREQTEKCRLISHDPQERFLLIEAYCWAENYQEAYRVFLETQKRFPDNWQVYIYGGDIYAALKKYEDAIQCWEKAGELGTDFYDEYYCKASFYADIGAYEKASAVYLELAALLKKDGYDEQAEMAKQEADVLKRKLK